MLRISREIHIPYNSIAGAIQRAEDKRVHDSMNELFWSFRGACDDALTKRSGAMHAFLNTPHPLVPHQTIGALAAHTLTDLKEPAQRGHIAIEIVRHPGRPMINAGTELCEDCPGERSAMVKLTVNLDHPYTHLWLHGEPPDDVLYMGITALADAAVLLAYELDKNQGGVLYRSDFLNQTI